MPVSVASWYSGSEGTMVGSGETEAVAFAMATVAEARAWTGSTIMLSELGCRGGNTTLGSVCGERRKKGESETCGREV